MRRSRTSRLLLSPALALAVSTVTAALAAQAPSDQAEQFFREGREALGRGDYATACPKFAESVRLTRRPGPLLNLAQCEEHQGHLLSALKHWREGSALLPAGDARAAVATEHVAALEKKVPKLILKLNPEAPAGTKIMLDGVEVSASAIGAAQELERGDHVIVTIARGYADTRSTIKLAEGDQREITMVPGSEPSQRSTQKNGPPSQAASPPVAPPPRSGARWTAGLVIGGIGLAGLAAGGVTGILAILKKPDYIQACGEGPVCTGAEAGELQNTLRALTTTSTVMFAVGGAGVVTGVILVATSSWKAPAASTSVAPTVLPGGGGFTVQGRF